MNRAVLIKKTIINIQKLPDTKVQEVSDFTEFLLSRIDDQLITTGIQMVASESNTFSFLNDEPDLYTVNDLKEKYK